MPKSIQAKLLRVIQDGVVRRVGSETTDAVVNVRFIAATNGDPEAAVTAGDMREDLYYRLRVVPINVPALRERPEDVPLLADYFLSTYWVRHRSKGAPFPRLTDAALRALCSCAWRGNVRELQNVIEHVAVVVEPGADIRPEDLHLTGDPTPEVTGANPASLISTLLEESYHAARDRVIAQFERQYLTWLVNRASGNMSKAARIAGVDRTTLYRLMERHGLQRSPTAGWVVEREPGVAAGGVDAPVEVEAGRAGAPPRADLRRRAVPMRARERRVGARPRRQPAGGPLPRAVLGGRHVRVSPQHGAADRRGEGARRSPRSPRTRASRGAGAGVVARAPKSRDERGEVHRHRLRGGGGATDWYETPRVLGPRHRGWDRPGAAGHLVPAGAAGADGRASPFLELRPGPRDLPQARDGHGYSAPGRNPTELGNPILL